MIHIYLVTPLFSIDSVWLSACLSLFLHVYPFGLFVFLTFRLSVHEQLSLFYSKPLHVWEGDCTPPPSPRCGCPLLNNSRGNPYLKILFFSNFLLRMSLCRKKIVLPPLRGLLFMVSKIAHALEG